MNTLLVGFYRHCQFQIKNLKSNLKQRPISRVDSLWRGYASSISEEYTKSIQSVANLIKNDKTKILVMTGAGLSTPSGIPDFRSPGTGLYHNIQKFDLPYPEAIFDLHYFMMDPLPFFTFAQELYPDVKYKPNKGHYFLRLLHEEKKLQKLYTQNIDGLEKLAGIPSQFVVEAHVTFATASCTLCGEKHDPEVMKQSILNGIFPIICQKNKCKGKVKPDIVFFGENLPNTFWNYKTEVASTDILLVIGTSLEVYPFAGIADAVGYKVPRILINQYSVGSFGDRPNDIILIGDLIEAIEFITDALGWTKKLETILNKERGTT